MPTSPREHSKRLPGLDGLRAIAIIAVVVYHLDPAWLPGGFLGVDLFFVISGFLITKLLLDQAKAGRDGVLGRMRDFYGRRARRILPATVLVVGILVPVAIGSTGLVRLEGGDALAGLGFATNWWQIIEGRDYFATWAAPSSLQHLWSLAIEEQFYLLWPALITLIVLVTRRHWRWVYALIGTIAVAGALASTWWMYHIAVTMDIPFTTGASRVYYGTDTHASGILIGAATAAFFALATHRRPFGRHRPGPARPPEWWARLPVELLGLAAIGGLVYVGLRVSELDPQLYRGGFLAVGVIGIVAVVCATRPWSWLGRALDVQPLRWIGLISFELYLWHWPVGVAWHSIQPDPGPFWLAVQVALMVALAGATHHWVTVPIWHPRPRAVTWPAVSTLSAVAAAIVVAVVAIPSALGGPVAPVFASLNRQVEVPTIPEPTQRQLGAAGLNLPISAFGDSVMMGARQSMGSLMPNITVLATGSAQFPVIYERIREARANGTLGEIVVIHHGNNGRLAAPELDQMLSELTDRTLVVLLTVKLPYPAQQAANNQVLNDVAAAYPNTVVADWLAAGTPHPEWFISDGTHLKPAGGAAYAQFVAAAIMAFEVPTPSSA
jgi:peptidoglycan/LPS O-acetylase OafA/YrhL